MNASHLIKDKTILITGGTGSFGQSFVYELLNKYSPKKVIVYSRDEWKQWQMKQRHEVFQSDRLRFFLGDVRDEARLRRAFYGVDIVVHAAALKQVPTAEYNPAEYVRTNVIGAMNVVEAAIVCRVKKILALSTDKAVSPINLYGATKLCLEKLFVGANLYSANQQCIFSVVRYGNVLGSRGSIISILQEKLKKKDKNIEITDKRMTRFWIVL